MSRPLVALASLSVWFAAALTTTATAPSRNLQLFDQSETTVTLSPDARTVTRSINVSVSPEARDVDGGFVGELRATARRLDADSNIVRDERLAGATLALGRADVVEEDADEDASTGVFEDAIGFASREIFSDGINDEDLIVTLTLADDVAVAEAFDVEIVVDASALFPTQVVGSPVPGRDPSLPDGLTLDLTLEGGVDVVEVDAAE